MPNQMKTVETIVAAYCSDFPVQINALVELIEENRSGKDLQSLVRTLKADLHRMGGAAHCLGFRQVGKQINDIEQDLIALGLTDNRSIRKGLAPLSSKISSLRYFDRILKPETSKLLQKVSGHTLEECTEDPDSREIARQESAKRMMSKERLLIAEDDPYVREMMTTTLLEMGAESVMQAASGYEVLNTLDTYQPTFLITDWEMEPVSGLEILRCIRRGTTNLAKDTPVIFFTSHNDRESSILANRNGVNRLVGKPVLPEALRDAVLQVVEKRFHLRSRNLSAA